MLYNHILRHSEPERMLYLAIPESAFSELFEGPVGTALVEREHLHLIVFDPQAEAILQWIH